MRIRISPVLALDANTADRLRSLLRQGHEIEALEVILRKPSLVSRDVRLRVPASRSRPQVANSVPILGAIPLARLIALFVAQGREQDLETSAVDPLVTVALRQINLDLSFHHYSDKVHGGACLKC